jgi:predicted amidophosphoribosyltransferase
MRSSVTQSLGQTESYVCPNCGKFYEGETDSGFCEECVPKLRDTVEGYLRLNADHLEYYISRGLSVWQAIDAISLGPARPICIVCGNRIKRGKRNAIFCRKYKSCRRYSRRYVYLYREKGMSKTDALAHILSELS